MPSWNCSYYVAHAHASCESCQIKMVLRTWLSTISLHHKCDRIIPILIYLAFLWSLIPRLAVGARCYECDITLFDCAIDAANVDEDCDSGCYTTRNHDNVLIKKGCDTQLTAAHDRSCWGWETHYTCICKNDLCNDDFGSDTDYLYMSNEQHVHCGRIVNILLPTAGVVVLFLLLRFQ
ncbi:hypothetical protein HELRODRAFT_172637 [Helobdella robusta]|uniref:Uncharacterized protein n=1 Tax=Helobdella robusta TaxID=6412 RepID=T1F5P3_HELRO|nr:hypothetical protein HELRODRAFT_172637 [Helobdella robusta]ESO04280.1 hypothetical protein HELRODRAFT_172637 [Helobdella robusta]